MTTTSAIELMRQLFFMTFWIGLPLLAIAFVVGVVISLLQVLTSIQDTSFSAVPRLSAFLGGLLLSMPWMLGKLMHYTTALFGDLGRFAR